MTIRTKRSLPNPTLPKDFVVNHPFTFYVLTKNGSIMFVGRMTNIELSSQILVKEEL